MARIDHFNLRAFDLNLMLAFDALFSEGSVTRAAKKLRIQQPAMSHSLSVLRLMLDDTLFVRVGHRMEPTPRAVQLSEPIRSLLERAQDVLLTRVGFDPALERRTFTIGLSDQLEVLLLPGLVRRLRSSAPGIRIMTRPTSRERVFDMLDAGEIDFAIGSFEPGPTWHRRARLMDEEHVCCFNADLLSLSTPVTLDAYLAAPHALVSRKDSMLGYLESALGRAGVQPDVMVSSASFFALLSLAAFSPILATAPRRIVARFASALDLVVSPLPFALEPLTVDLAWHARADLDESTRWMRDAVMELARTLNGDGP
jgi:LysR family transcriptional activator of mexEF-oprN operon